METSGWITIAVVAGILIFLLIFIVAIYNSLVDLRNLWKNKFAQIDVMLKRRYDLIPNLVESAKGYMKHERETLEAVIAARNQAVSALKNANEQGENPESMQKLLQAEGQVGATLGRLFALAESYPDLKANENINTLMKELTDTENRIMYARQDYNDAVTKYNTTREVFPNIMIAGMFGFFPATLFEIVNAVERENVKVKF